MRSSRIIAAIGIPLLAFLLSSRVPTQGAPQTPASVLVGTWETHRGQSDFKLVLNADGKGSLNGLALQWQFAGGNLTLAAARGTFKYNASLAGDSLTLSGGDLKQPLVFQRAAPPNQSPGLFDSGGYADTLPIPGDPPLTQEMVDKGSRFFEWLLDAQLTDEQRGQFRDSLIRTWKSGNPDDIQATLNVLKFSDDLQKKSPEEREIYRAALRTKFLELMRQNPNDTLSRWVLDIYDSAHQPIAAGNPPLTPQETDAYAEFVSFMVTECMGKKAFNPDRTFKDALAQNLAARYGSYTPEEQKQFSQVPVLWAALRLKWAQISEPEREKYRKQWAPSAQALLSGSTQGDYSNDTESAAKSSSSGPSSDAFEKLREHNFVNMICNRSFATTMSLHLSMWK